MMGIAYGNALGLPLPPSLRFQLLHLPLPPSANPCSYLQVRMKMETKRKDKKVRN